MEKLSEMVPNRALKVVEVSYRSHRCCNSFSQDAPTIEKCDQQISPGSLSQYNQNNEDCKMAMGRRRMRNAERRRKKGKTVEKTLSKTDHLKAMRSRLWVAIAKREINKTQKARNINQKERMNNSRKVAGQCMRVVRQKALLSQRPAKETLWRAKRLTREMQTYWKRFDRVEKLQKKQQEKEAEEQHKMNLQMLEAKRQQRKLNFLITQTELYAHFMAKKIVGTTGETDKSDAEGIILEQLTDEKLDGRLAHVDDYDGQEAQRKAKNNALQAVEAQEVKTKAYDSNLKHIRGGGASEIKKEEERPQPKLFRGTLKTYQLKGMNWLLSLYDQGINGILADEMGLGKTVQALAMLAYIAETYGQCLFVAPQRCRIAFSFPSLSDIWGPFLVITPASTLHNWQQEVERFVPTLKVVPYWGSPSERKVLRHFWERKNLHTRNASFHLVITNYQVCRVVKVVKILHFFSA